MRSNFTRIRQAAYTPLGSCPSQSYPRVEIVRTAYKNVLIDVRLSRQSNGNWASAATLTFPDGRTELLTAGRPTFPSGELARDVALDDARTIIDFRAQDE